MKGAFLLERCRNGALCLLAVLALSISYAADATAVSVEEPLARSQAISMPRIALIIQPLPASVGGRAAVAVDDRGHLSKRLREIGFAVWTLGPADRPELSRDIRSTASRVPEGAEILLVALGASVGSGDDVFVLPSPQAAGADALEAEGIRLGDILRRLAERRPKELVAIIDECRPLTGDRCSLDGVARSNGASVIGAERVRGEAGSGPLAARASLRPALFAVTEVEGQPLPDAFVAIEQILAGSDLRARAGSRLSASFAFVPAGFFEGLSTPCNRIDPAADPVALRSVVLDPILGACERAAAAYPFVRFFADRLGVGREQRAYQRAVASCDDRLAAASYRSSYPAGRFLGIVESFLRDCERRAQDARDEKRAQDARDEQRRRDEEARLRDLERQRAEDQRRREEQQRRQDAERREQEQRQARGPQFHYIQGTEPPPRGYGWVALRLGPGSNFDWYRDVKLWEGTLLTVLRHDGPWTQVRLQNGRTGWAASEFIKCCRTAP